MMRKLGKVTAQLPSQLRANSGMVIVNMGPSGAGKTTLLETLVDTPEHADQYGPVAVLDIDGKARVLRDNPHIDIFPAVTWAMIAAHCDALSLSCKPFKTIVWDGLAIMQSKSHEHVGVDKQDNPQLRQNLYGKANVLMIQVAQLSKILAEQGVNVIFNTWSKPKTLNTDTKVEMTQPDLTDKLLRDFIGIMDFVVYTECNSKIMVAGRQVQGPYPPIMRTGGSTEYATRTAVSPDSPLRDMPDIIYNPSLSTILDCFHGAPWPTAKHAKPTYS